MNKKMNKENNNTPFKAEDVDWNELAAIGILKDEPGNWTPSSRGRRPA